MDWLDGPAEPDAWGIYGGYWDVNGQWHDVPRQTVQAVLSAMGAAEPVPPTGVPLVTVSADGPWPSLPPGEIELDGGGIVMVGGGPGAGTGEDGRASAGAGDERPGAPEEAMSQGPPEALAHDRAGLPGHQPAGLPLGYHRFKPADGGGELVLAVCPPRCPSPPPARTWGWSVQLYAARSASSWGIGDFADLRRLSRWAGKQGAGFILLNPLHAPAPGAVPEPSPYFPSSRCFLNPLYICVDEVPGAANLGSVSALGEKARSLNSERLVDRERVWALKSQALEELFELSACDGDPVFNEYVRARGRVLDGYTSFCALAEQFGLPWQDWPEQYRRPESAAVAAFAGSAEGKARKRYYAWLQWLCEVQLDGAGAGLSSGLMLDLAVGVDGGGADAWLWQDAFALGMRVGAPPDDFNTKGQNWALPPLDPWKLRAASYEPFIETLRAVLRPAKGLRVDHVMGLFRLFWVPVGEEPRSGTYVRYVWEDMVRLLRLEAERAGVYVVGEDLGTVEDHVRAVLAESGVLSYKLFWFEDRPPGEWAQQAMGAVTTHDLPTVAGVWTGADLDALKSLGLPYNEEGSNALWRRLSEWTGSASDRPLGDVIEAAYGVLSRAPCALLAAALDDAAAVRERPNMPGTIDQWPNWCLALPLTLEQLEESELAAAIAAHLSGGAST
ncbi:MAG TPA: 4-alpha-glucanotransferase [Acidimicrobiales bacterium]|nr:4-alpha-glucanotransferase [Acidimicrobiales bacterium]